MNSNRQYGSGCHNKALYGLGLSGVISLAPSKVPSTQQVLNNCLYNEYYLQILYVYMYMYVIAVLEIENGLQGATFTAFIVIADIIYPKKSSCIVNHSV